MGMGMVALLAGLGSGYSQGVQQKREYDRQMAMDQIAKDKNAREQKNWQDQQDMESRLKAAGATQDPNNPTVGNVNYGDGQDHAYTMPNASDIASSDIRQFQRNTQNATMANTAPNAMPAGTAPTMTQAAPTDDSTPGPVATPSPAPDPTQQPATDAAPATPVAPVAPMSPVPSGGPTANALSTKPTATYTPGIQQADGSVTTNPASMQTAAAAWNDPQAQAARIAQAYKDSGHPELATQQQLAALQLDDARRTHINNIFNDEVSQEIAANGGDVAKGIASILTKTQQTGNNQYTVQTQGGKGTILRVGQNGAADTPVMSFEDSPAGRAELLANVSRLPMAQKLQYAFEANKARLEQNADTRANAANKRADEMQPVEIDYKKAGAQMERAKASMYEAKPDANNWRIGQEDQITLKGIDDQMRDLAKQRTAAIVNGTMKAGDPADKDIQVQIGQLRLQSHGILSKYSDGAAAPNPEGLPPKPGAAAPGAAPAASGPPPDSDRYFALMAERRASAMRLDTAQNMQDAAGEAREVQNLKALDAEIGKIPKAEIAKSKWTGAPTQSGTDLAGADAKTTAALTSGAPAAPTMTQTVAPKPAPKPAAPAPVPSKLQLISKALGSRGTGSPLDTIIESKAPKVLSAGQDLEQATAAMHAAAQSGDQAAIKTYGAQLTAARAKVDAILKDLAPEQANAIRTAIGYQ